MFVGNDIVDILRIKTHPRFLKRICQEEEELILNSYHTDFDHEASFATSPTVWTLWAIKEATFKALKKIRPSISFIPRLFLVKQNPWRCQFEDLSVSVEVLQAADYIHALALYESNKRPVIAIAPSASVASESIAARTLASQLLRGLGFPGCSIENTPPQVMQGGKTLQEIDVSLSHDHRFLAVALLLH